MVDVTNWWPDADPGTTWESADAHFGALGAKAFQAHGRGVVVVRVTDGAAIPTYYTLDRLVDEGGPAIVAGELAESYDPQHQTVIVYLDEGDTVTRVVVADVGPLE